MTSRYFMLGFVSFLGCGTPSGGACQSSADCPVNGDGKCATVCGDGSNPCLNACIEGHCAPRGCGDAGLVGLADLAAPTDLPPASDAAHPSDLSASDGAIGCKTTADCPPNPGADCAMTCADGSNPCVNACINSLCKPRGCPSVDGGVCAPDAGLAAANCCHAIGDVCTKNGDCCSGNCITRNHAGYCCVPGGCP